MRTWDFGEGFAGRGLGAGLGGVLPTDRVRPLDDSLAALGEPLGERFEAALGDDLLGVFFVSFAGVMFTLRLHETKQEGSVEMEMLQM